MIRSWLLLSATCGVATILIGWWAVPIVTAVWTLALPQRGGVLTATLAGATAWGAILLFAARTGRIDEVASVLGGIFGTSGAAVVALTLCYGALLGGS